jgi:hypothetical protein
MLNVGSVNLLSDQYIRNHKLELGYIPEWLGVHSGWLEGKKREAERDYSLFQAAGTARNSPWPKLSYFSSTGGFKRGLPSFEAEVSQSLQAASSMYKTRSKGYDHLMALIPSQKDRLEALLTSFPLTRNVVDQPGHYILGFQELMESSKVVLESGRYCSHPRVIARQHGSGADDFACIMSDLQIEMNKRLVSTHKPYVLATGHLPLVSQVGEGTSVQGEGASVRIGVFCAHGEGGEFDTYTQKSGYMIRLLKKAMEEFEEGLEVEEAAVMIVMGDWNVQWADDDGKSAFEDALHLQHYQPSADSVSMYAHEYGNAGTVIDHIAWKTYGAARATAVPGSAFVEQHSRYVNAPILFGYCRPPAPLEQCVTDHAPVGVRLCVQLGAENDGTTEEDESQWLYWLFKTCFSAGRSLY